MERRSARILGGSRKNGPVKELGVPEVRSAVKGVGLMFHHSTFVCIGRALVIGE